MSASKRIEIKSFRLEGLPFFKDQSFDFQRKGVSLILGKNFDSSNENPNAAGKSLFFSELAELITRRPLIGERRDTIRRGSRELTFTKRGHEYKVVRKFSPGEKLTIFKDGEDLGYRELSSAEAALEKLIPYTEQEVLSLLYIDARIPHPLVRGGAAQRRDFFIRFFKMNAAPTMRKVVKAELDQIAVSSGGLEEVNRQIKELKARVDSREVDPLEERLVRLEAKQSALSSKARVFSRANRVLLAHTENKDRIRGLKDLGVTDIAELKAERDRVSDALETCAVQLNAWDEYERLSSSNEEAAKERESLEKTLGLKSSQGADKLLASLQVESEAAQDAHDKAARRLARIKTSLVDCNKTEQSAVEDRLAALEKQIRALKTEVGKCPTCGADFDNAHAESELSSAREKKAKMRKSLSSMADLEINLLAERVDFRAHLARAEKTLSELASKLSAAKRLRRIQSADKVEPPSVSKERLSKRVAVLRFSRVALEGAEEALHARLEWSELSEEHREVARGEDPTERLMSTSQSIGVLRAEIDELKVTVASLASKREKRDKLTEQLGEKPALELLLAALSKGGIDSLMIKAVCDRLSQLVNMYAKTIFPEDYRFSFELESQFSFLVTRKYGKKEETSDVRKLSGAESLLFNLVLFAALMSFVPEQNRLNLLMLDEPTSTMGPEMIESFVRFLPVLNAVVPHIVVITPMPHSDYPGAKIWTVVKKNGVSQFFEGREVSLEKVNAARSSRGTKSKSVKSSIGG